MDNGSIRANVQFISFKMDKIDFSVTQNLETLASQNHTDTETVYSIGFRNTIKFLDQPQTFYVTGLQVGVAVKSKKSSQELAKGTFIITGLFSADGTLETKLEENLVKIQGPAILLPYLRATVSTILSNAGFSSVPMPLININEAARNANITIEERHLK